MHVILMIVFIVYVIGMIVAWRSSGQTLIFKIVTTIAWPIMCCIYVIFGAYILYNIGKYLQSVQDDDMDYTSY